MSLTTNIMVKFKEYKSYSFDNLEDGSPLKSVIEPDQDKNEIAPEDIDGKWVYVFRETSFTPEDGIPVLVNSIRVRSGHEYPLALYERNSSFTCLSFFCLSRIELSPVRIEELRKKVQNLLRNKQVPVFVSGNIPIKCERLTLIPLSPDQPAQVAPFFLGQFLKEEDAIFEESDGKIKATVFLHDYLTVLEDFTKEYKDHRDSYIKFLNGTDDTFQPISWRINKNQSNLLSGLIRSFCNNEQYQRNIDYEAWSKWDTESLEEHLKWQIPVKYAEAKILEWLKTEGLNATLFDYEYGQNDSEIRLPEDFTLSFLEKTQDSVPISQFLSEILQNSYEKANECSISLGEDQDLVDVSALVGESNWWICYVGGFRNTYKNEVKPITSSTSKILQLLSIPMASHARPTTVFDYIRDNRYKTSMVVFKPGESFIMKGKACTTELQFRNMVISRYAGRYGTDIEVVGEGDYWVAKYKTKVVNKGASQAVKGVADAIGDAMQIFDFACNVYDLCNAETFSDSLKAQIGLARSVLDIYTNFFSKRSSTLMVQSTKSFSAALGIFYGAISYQQLDKSVSILWRQGNYELAYARSIQRDTNILLAGSSIATMYGISASLAAGALASNAAIGPGQIAALILGILALVVYFGVSIWESTIYRNILEKWLQHCNPWGVHFSTFMPEDLPWTRFVDLNVNTTNPISYPIARTQRNSMENTNQALDYIQNSYLIRAQFKDAFDSNSKYFIRENAPYSLLEMTVAFSGPLPVDKDKFEMNLELHNGYHYIPLDLSTDFDLPREKRCNRGVDSETGQTVYYINWGDESLNDDENSDSAQHFCDEKMTQFNALWQYSAIEKDLEKENALRKLNESVKNDILPMNNLQKILILLSQLRIDPYGLPTSGKHDVFIRASSNMIDSDGSSVIHIVDSSPIDFSFYNNYGMRGSGAPTVFSEEFKDRFLEYRRLTRGGKPPRPSRLPLRFQSF